MCLRDVLIVCLSPDASNLACYSSSVITLTTFFYNKLFLSICLSYQTMSSDFKVCKDMLLLLLSHFSPVRLCVTPQTAAHQAPPSLGFSKQEHWSGLPFPSPMHKSEREVAQSSPTLSDPMNCSLSGSSVHGIFQVRVLEWGAIAYSHIYFLRMLHHNRHTPTVATFQVLNSHVSTSNASIRQP